MGALVTGRVEDWVGLPGCCLGGTIQGARASGGEAAVNVGSQLRAGLQWRKACACADGEQPATCCCLTALLAASFRRRCAGCSPAAPGPPRE